MTHPRLRPGFALFHTRQHYLTRSFLCPPNPNKVFAQGSQVLNWGSTAASLFCSPAVRCRFYGLSRFLQFLLAFRSYFSAFRSSIPASSPFWASSARVAHSFRYATRYNSMSLFLLSNNETLKPLKKLFSLLHSVSTAAMLHSIATLALFHIKGKKSCQPYVYHVGVGALLRRASSHTTFAQLATAHYTRSAGRFAGRFAITCYYILFLFDI